MYRSILNLLLFFKPKTEMKPTPEMEALQSLTAQSPLYDPDLIWIDINDLKPEYNFPILIWDGKITHRDWIRTSSDNLFGDDMYVNNLNQVMFEDDIVQWAYTQLPFNTQHPFYTVGKNCIFNKHDKWTIIDGEVFVKKDDNTYIRVTSNGKPIPYIT